MVFTIAEQLDIFDHHNILGITDKIHFILKGFAEHLGNFLIGIIHALKHFIIHAGNTVRCILQAFPIRVITQGDQDTTDMFFDCIGINSHNFLPFLWIIRHVSPGPR